MENEDHGSKQDQLEELFPVPTKLGKGLAHVKRTIERHPDFDEIRNLTHHPRSERRKVTLGTDAPAQRLKPTGSFPTYGSVVKSTANPARRARKARDHAFVLSFLKAHGIE